LIMDVTIGNVFDTNHNFKPNTLLSISNSKCIQCADDYQRQCLAFAPIVANSLGQFDTLQFLLNLVDHQAKNTFGFTIDLPSNITSRISPPSTQQENNYTRVQGLKYHENSLRLLTCDSKASHLE
jgi:hypothetical protein